MINFSFNNFVLPRLEKRPCTMCKTEILPLDSEIFPFRGKTIYVCKSCGDKIEALLSDDEGVIYGPSVWE